MNQLAIASPLCDRCGAELHADGAVCPRCAVPAVADGLQTAASCPPVAVQVLDGPPSFLDNRLVVAGLLLAAGPVGLPALWFSRRFSRFTKIATTVVFFLLTAVLPLAVTWYCCDVALRPLVDAMSHANRMP